MSWKIGEYWLRCEMVCCCCGLEKGRDVKRCAKKKRKDEDEDDCKCMPIVNARD